MHVLIIAGLVDIDNTNFVLLPWHPCAHFLSMFISFLYMFRATMCPSSGETTVSMRNLVPVTPKQVDSLKLQGRMS